VPFQCTVRVLLSRLPTAQAFRAEVAATPPSESLPGGFGLGTRFHAVPFATAGAAAVEQRGRGGKIRSWEGTRDRGSAGKTEGGFPGARIRRSVRHTANLADGSLQPMCLRDELCLGEGEDLSSARCEHGEQSASGLPGDRSAR
jgi:hypothetical protein